MNSTASQTTGPSIPEKLRIYRGNGEQHNLISTFEEAPPWRQFGAGPNADTPNMTEYRGKGYFARPEEIEAVNLALYLRRPLMVTGAPGTGKSTLAHAIAYELGLDEVLVWPITSRSTLQQGLYQYDAIGRLQEVGLNEKLDSGVTSSLSDIGRFIRLGPLGTALYRSKPNRPCVVLVDEIDKSDIDLPNDLLHVFEDGEFEIPELSRLSDKHPEIEVSLHRGVGSVPVRKGRVRCEGFPIVVLTSNGERDFSPAFLRRCIRLDIKPPNTKELTAIVTNWIGHTAANAPETLKLISLFMSDRDTPERELATDQLLNAAYLLTKKVATIDLHALRQFVLRPLTNASVENHPSESDTAPS